MTDGDDAAGDGDDVEEAHEDAEQDEVTDVQDAEDDQEGHAHCEHQQALSEEPFAHFDFGLAQGEIESAALGEGEEGEEEVVSLAAFEHEVDAEKDGGDDVEDVGEPGGQGVEEESADVTGEVFGFGGEGVEAELVGHGEMLDAGDDRGDALGQVGEEGAQVARDGGQADPEEQGEEERRAEEEDDDGDGAGGLPAADAEVGDLADDGREDDREEGGDVDDFEFFEDFVAETEEQDESKCQEDGAAGGGALLDHGGRRGGRGVGPGNVRNDRQVIAPVGFMRMNLRGWMLNSQRPCRKILPGGFRQMVE